MRRHCCLAYLPLRRSFQHLTGISLISRMAPEIDGAPRKSPDCEGRGSRDLCFRARIKWSQVPIQFGDYRIMTASRRASAISPVPSS